MSREIKFRAWDHTNERIPDGEIVLGFDGTTHWNNSEYEFPLSTNTVKIDMYTGLKDKNDKEIYEGDIMQISLPAGGFWGNVDLKKIGEVKFSEDQAGFIAEWEYSKHQHHKSLDCDIAHTGEVIGNIYENPELID